jgi:TolB protein
LDVEAQEALIKEARRRARRRQMGYAASTLAVGAIVLAGFGVSHRGGGRAGRSAESAARPATAPISRLPANGVLAIEDRKSLDVTNPDRLFAVNSDGSGLRQLARCQGTAGDCYLGAYGWSPDGTHLAFLSGHVGGAITVSNLFLFVVNSDGTGMRRLARCGNCDTSQNLSWSPDSRRIVFATRGEGSAPNLIIVNAVTGAERRLPASGVNPVWSPAGTRIAFGQGAALFSIKADGSGIAQLVQQDSVANPAWSPDGTMITFDAGDGIYVVDADGSHLRLLFSGPPAGGPGYPSWSPGGNRILFLDTPRVATGFAAEVWTMKPDGSGQRSLYRSPCCGFWSPPIWSPDGKAIAVGMSAYTAKGITRKGILVMDAQGNHQRRVLGNPEAIAWQPIPRTP